MPYPMIERARELATCSTTHDPDEVLLETRLARELLSLTEVLEEMGAKFAELQQWARAYPVKTFPEPDFEKAHRVLTENGMTLDAISASNMRHVLTRVGEISDAALARLGERR